MGAIKEKFNSIDKQPKSKKSSKKLKWREIELLKEQHQLEKELKAFDDSLAYMFDD